jgi:hypothetical protein
MTMRKLLGHAPLLFLLAGLAGCASTEPYGNFLGANAPAALNERLAADTVKQLTVLYPPASTRFDLGQPTPDAYGSALVESLRIKGYAILEFEPDEAAPAGNPEHRRAGAEPALCARRTGQHEPLPRHGDGRLAVPESRLRGAER